MIQSEEKRKLSKIEMLTFVAIVKVLTILWWICLAVQTMQIALQILELTAEQTTNTTVSRFCFDYNAELLIFYWW